MASAFRSGDEPALFYSRYGSAKQVGDIARSVQKFVDAAHVSMWDADRNWCRVLAGGRNEMGRAT